MAEEHEDRPSLDAVYSALAARRSQFDNLLWQAPVLSLTAQAFLMTTALGGGVTRYARTVACVLSIVVALLSIQILTRHRQAEVTDAHWLADLERAGNPTLQVHGTEWRKRRNTTSPDAGVFNPFARLPGYFTWAAGMSLFGVASLLTLVIEWVRPDLLQP
ncbi:hypothetical protein [Nostocoides vanveenii]|uniref:Uncharacterized protein n=1 Tax=Nostocoides vanveenii TaxID=330835 RepID=A0ABP4W4L1_9MICO